VTDVTRDRPFGTSSALAAELDRMHKANLLKICPAIGQSPDDGHNFMYLGIQHWEPDVFKFLDDHVKR
jgi:hypothetical protein